MLMMKISQEKNDFRLILKIVFTAKLVISRTPHKTLTGLYPKEVEDLNMSGLELFFFPLNFFV
jgi:hypothetical protein